MPSSDEIKLQFTGVFSLINSVRLAAAASFAEGFRSLPEEDGGQVFDLAFLLEGSWSSVGVRLYAREEDVFFRMLDNPAGASAANVKAKLEQILSLDVDGFGFEQIARLDPVIADLAMQLPGIRPVLIPSPYEAAARAIIGHRLFVRQAAALCSRIAFEHGVSLKKADGVAHIFPAPGRLAELTPVQGLADRKVNQLRALGSFAIAGGLDSALLRTMRREAALTYLQRLPGIGPFSAELILLRGIGDPDAFPMEEKRFQRAMSKAYQLGDDPSPETLQKIASQWQPYRSWVGLLLRNCESGAAINANRHSQRSVRICRAT